MPQYTKSQKIGREGVNILATNCDKLGFLFREQGDDLGIDGEIELFIIDGENADIKVQVQVKSSECFTKSSSGEINLLSLTRKHLEYWNDRINFPVMLICVETKTKNIYWLDTSPFYQKIIKTSQKTISTSTTDKNLLNMANKKTFIQAVKKLNVQTSNRVISSDSTIEKLRILGIERGYNTFQEDNGESLTLIGTESSLKNPINGSMELKNQIDEHTYNIKDFILKLGNDTVKEYEEGILKIVEVNENIEIFFKSRDIEYKILSEKNIRGNKGIIKSKKGELLQFTIEIDIPTLKINISLDYNPLNYKNIEDLSDMLTFCESIKEGFEISTLDKKGRKIPITSGKMRDTIVGPGRVVINYMNLLHKVESMFNIKFLIEKVLGKQASSKDICDTIPILEGIVKGEYEEKNRMTISVTTSESIPSLCLKGDQLMTFEYPNYELFGIKLPLTLCIDCIGKLKKTKNGYQLISKSSKFYTKKSLC